MRIFLRKNQHLRLLKVVVLVFCDFIKNGEKSNFLSVKAAFDRNTAFQKNSDKAIFFKKRREFLKKCEKNP